LAWECAGITEGLLEEGKKKEVVPVLDGLESLAESFLGQAESGEIRGAYQAMLEAMERELLAKAMEKSGGNQAKAARWLGVTRYTLREKLTRYGLRG